MNSDRAQAASLAAAIRDLADSVTADLLVCPPSVYLQNVAERVADSRVSLGAQNVYFAKNGAFTGELSVEMLRDVGCEFVILGHSERRQILGETDQDVNQKLASALAGGLIPIVCVGETLEQRESGQTQAVVAGQMAASLAGLTAEQMAQTVVAYEPVWAIGTGKVATSQQAQEVHADLRKQIENRYNFNVSSAVRILYGGSVKPENAAELLDQVDIDGALVGGASLDASSFIDIAKAWH